MLTTAVSGFLVSLSLILAIGAQNAFVLRQGLRREHVLAVVLVCGLSDAMLIVAGIAGFGALAETVPWLGTAMRYGGAAFLLLYGGLRFRAAMRGGAALRPAPDVRAPLSLVLATCLTLTWANPHVYLDTLVLIGSISTKYAPLEWAFGAGAVLASFGFFAALGFGARLLTPLFAKPRAWVVLELVVGVTMWAIALGLLIS